MVSVKQNWAGEHPCTDPENCSVHSGKKEEAELSCRSLNHHEGNYANFPDR